MPVSFLTNVQKQCYGRYTGEPTIAQLNQYFHLDQTDRAHITRRRQPHNVNIRLTHIPFRKSGTFQKKLL